MALVGHYLTHEGVDLPSAFWVAHTVGLIAEPEVIMHIFAHEQAERDGRPPVTQLPLGRFVLDPALPTGPQVYAQVKARHPHLKDAIAAPAPV